MIFHLLTAVLFLLKVLGVITVSWWIVLAPSLFLFGYLGVLFTLMLMVTIIAACAGASR